MTTLHTSWTDPLPSSCHQCGLDLADEYETPIFIMLGSNRRAGFHFDCHLKWLRHQAELKAEEEAEL